MKKRVKYTFKILRSDNHACIYESKRKFRNKKYCYKYASWFCMMYGFSPNMVKIGIQPYENI